MKTKSEENGIKSAFPLRWDLSPNEACVEFGLTKREYFAAMAIQGLIAGNYQFGAGNVETHRATIAEEACLYADALLAKLAESEAGNE